MAISAEQFGDTGVSVSVRLSQLFPPHFHSDLWHRINSDNIKNRVKEEVKFIWWASIRYKNDEINVQDDVITLQMSMKELRKQNREEEHEEQIPEWYTKQQTYMQ